MDTGMFPGRGTGRIEVITSFTPWSFPRNTNFVSIFSVNPGASGGGGATGASGTARGGGGGGGCGSVNMATFARVMLCDTLYFFVGKGGASVAAGAAGNAAASHSFVAVTPNAAGPGTPGPLVLNAGGTLAGGGGAGTALTGGAGGGAGGISSRAQAAYSCFALGYAPTAGQAGVAGGAQTGAVGTAVTWGASGLVLSSGAGGGGVGIGDADNAGGAVTAPTGGIFSTLAGGLAAAGAGQRGYTINDILFGILPIGSNAFPFTALGGSGGGTAGAAGVGGRGGDGAPGCGGAGGGGGVLGGASGAGGDGFHLVHAW